MKRLSIIVLPIMLFLFSYSYGQDVLITNLGTVYKGKMIHKGDYNIAFKAEGYLSTQDVRIRTIESLILADGTTVIKNGYFVEEASLTNVRNMPFSTIGGALIGISGLLLYSNNQRTVDDNATLQEFEEFADESKSNTDLSYLLLVLGGLLIAIDNS